MPRLIAGTLLDIGLGLKRAECIPAILSGQEPAGAPAPALGLCLTGTRYA
jgi:tRNA pseudouridine38-40 synthase